MTSRAIVFYGKVGTYGKPRVTPTGAGDIGLWRTCAQTARRQVLAPWLAAGRVDVFVQSWNAGPMAIAMDEYWADRLTASDHAAQNASLRCPIAMKLCERTMWALLGMKRGLALRAAFERLHGVRHHAVLVARHDVYWRNPMPTLLTDGSTRLWMPFDCQVNYCRNGPSAYSDCAGHRLSNGTKLPPPWMALKHSKSAYYGIRCDEDGSHAQLPDARAIAVCENTVLIDWWFVADATLANGFSETFDSFERYSQLVQTSLRLNISAPHQYWGLYFFTVHRLRSQCQLSHAMLHGLDFTLGRFVPQGENATSTCKYGRNERWRPYWQPERGECDASRVIPGYRTMCPGAPARPIEYACEAST